MRKPMKCVGLLSGLALLPMSVAVGAEPGVNALNYPGPAWSPYVAGAGIGVLSWLTFYFSDKPIGVSSFYAHIAGFLGKLIAPRRTQSLAYFKAKPPRVSWGFVFVVATIVGGGIAALTGGEFTELSALLKGTIEKWGDLGKVLLPDLLHLPRRAFAIGLAVALITIILVLERFTIR